MIRLSVPALSDASKNILYLAVSLVQLLLMYCLVDAVFYVVSIWANFVIAILFFFNREDVLDPRVVFPVFYCMYQTWFPLSVFVGADNVFKTIDGLALSSSLVYSFIGLVAYIFVCGLFVQKNSGKSSLMIRRATRPGSSGELLLIAALLVVVLICSIVIFNSGFTSKREINDGAGVEKFISEFSMLTLTIVALLRAVRLSMDRLKCDPLILLVIFVCIFYLALTGERDIFFRLMLCLMLIYYFKMRNFSKLKLLVFAVGIALLVPVSQSFKAVMVSGFVGIDFDLNKIFSNEFISASRNIYSVLYFEAERNPYLLISDIGRAVIPSMFFGEDWFSSANTWFNKEFLLLNGFSGRTGWGFGLVPEGYVVGGVGGVIAVMSLTAFMISICYRLRLRSEYFLVFYLFAFSVSIYVIRADVANLLSQMFKIGGLAIFTVFLFERTVSVLFTQLRVNMERL
ncbi:oligosaccharide repeat unit polymerase [Pseudomonas stutzeri]|uniref:oligosaccharide repeat unit polymerase n=1 Tax=Stutzerimonas stutzeri TaxID=316 RepID=UPI002108D801|nr:oligosaccharide repeat unit polymerase [Stutzerimonas stutzeri]MCQ4306541.1 oligosaccharide repeat unit polymerase [Stutzerimonas stutzeri]